MQSADVLAVILLLVSCCGSTTAQQAVADSAQTAEYCALLENSEDHRNRIVRVRGVYRTDFELSALSTPECPMMPTWVEFEDQWEKRTSWRDRRTINHMQWRVPMDVVFIGKFESGGRYGHMDAYWYKLTVYRVEAVKPLKTPLPVPESK